MIGQVFQKIKQRVKMECEDFEIANMRRVRGLLFFLAASGLSCGTRHLSLWRTGFSLVVAHGLRSARAQ